MHKIVLIGASTGGPGHLKKIISAINSASDSIFIIAQHMNENVIESFTSQLSQVTSLPVHLANSKIQLKCNNIYVCAKTLECFLHHNDLYLDKGLQTDIYTPSVNILFNSMLKLLPHYEVTAILLTGIGADGAKEMSSICQNGGYCIAESEQSAIVYGMPKKAYELNNNIEVMHLDAIIEYVKNV